MSLGTHARGFKGSPWMNMEESRKRTPQKTFRNGLWISRTRKPNTASRGYSQS